MKETNKDYRLYILMRVDLQSLTPGRACAQASHATNAFMKAWGSREDVKEWQKQTKQGFGTAIVLGVTLNQLEGLLTDPTFKKVIPGGKVIDPEYGIRVNREVADLLHQNYDAKFCTYEFRHDLEDEKTVVILRKEITCYYVFGTKEELEPWLGVLPLY
jgi:hypothetical protein